MFAQEKKPEKKTESKDSTDQEIKDTLHNDDPNEHFIAKISENENIIGEGINTLKLSNGVIYEGEVKNGKRQGKGKQKWREGTIFEGEWRDDKAAGKGIKVSYSFLFFSL